MTTKVSFKNSHGEYTIELQDDCVTSYEALSLCFHVLSSAGYSFGLPDYDESTLSEMVNWFIEENASTKESTASD